MLNALTEIFRFDINNDVHNCDMEILVQKEDEKMKFNDDYKKRFVATKENIVGERFTPIIFRQNAKRQ